MQYMWTQEQVATPAHVKARWSAGPPGMHFRCGLCAHKFVVGDRWRGVMANITGSPTRHGNFLVCGACLDRYVTDAAMLAARAELEREVERLGDLGLFVERGWWERRQKGGRHAK